MLTTRIPLLLLSFLKRSLNGILLLINQGRNKRRCSVGGQLCVVPSMVAQLPFLWASQAANSLQALMAI